MYSPNIPITEGIIKNSSNRPTKVVCRPRAGSAESVPAAVCSGTGSWFCCDFFVLLDDDPMLVVMCILCKIFRCCFYRLKRCLGMHSTVFLFSLDDWQEMVVSCNCKLSRNDSQRFELESFDSHVCGIETRFVCSLSACRRPSGRRFVHQHDV